MSFSSYKLNPLDSSRDFEHLMVDYCMMKYPGKVSLFGCSGQKQYGIDIIIENGTELTGVQCKNYIEKRMTIYEIDKIIELAESFLPKIIHLIIAIAGKNDAQVQRHILELNQQRHKEGAFSVEVIYWDEITCFLKNNSDLLSKYYPHIRNIKLNSTLINTTKELKEAFLEMYYQYRIQDLLDDDIFTGIYTENIILYDMFSEGMKGLLQCASLLTQQKEYGDFFDYIQLLNQYMDFLVPLAQPCNNGQQIMAINPRTHWGQVVRPAKGT